MFNDTAPRIPTPIIQAIEDAVFFGNIKEIDGILDLVCDDSFFPTHLKYGLEALMYFRMYYGKGGDLEPRDENERQKVLQTESVWGRDIIEMIGHYPDMSATQYA
jgi:hypothetical protein